VLDLKVKGQSRKAPDTPHVPYRRYNVEVAETVECRHRNVGIRASCQSRL